MKIEIKKLLKDFDILYENILKLKYYFNMNILNEVLYEMKIKKVNQIVEDAINNNLITKKEKM